MPSTMPSGTSLGMGPQESMSLLSCSSTLVASVAWSSHRVAAVPGTGGQWSVPLFLLFFSSTISRDSPNMLGSNLPSEPSDPSEEVNRSCEELVFRIWPGGTCHVLHVLHGQLVT